jgi:hypothetical protein
LGKARQVASGPRLDAPAKRSWFVGFSDFMVIRPR